MVVKFMESSTAKMSGPIKHLPLRMAIQAALTNNNTHRCALLRFREHLWGKMAVYQRVGHTGEKARCVELPGFRPS
jgi:hypothetical protein